MELSKILIGMSLSIIVVMGFVLFIADGVNKFNPTSIPTDYNESFYRISTNFDSLTNISNEAQSKTSFNGTGVESTNFDFLGFFFGQGYKASKVFMGGMNLLNDMVYVTVDNTIGGTPMGSIVTSVLLGIIVIIIVGFLLHFVIKSDRI